MAAFPPLRSTLILACAGVFAAACSGSSAEEAVDGTAQNDTRLTVTILGSGTPVPNRDQAGTAILVQANDETLLVDCGRACSTRLAAYDPSLLTKVDRVFLTHLHSDHISGLPDLWLNGWTQGRTGQFQVWGPAGTSDLFAGIEAAYSTDIASRIRPAGPMEAGSLNVSVTTLPLDGGMIFESGDLSVTTFPVRHGNLSAYGYRVAYGEESVLISGDTTVTPTLTEFAADTDVLLLEVASPAMVSYVRNTFAEPQADAIIGLHMTAPQAAGIMAQVSPHLAVYYHTVASCETDPALLEATEDLYAGNVMVARDLMQIRLTPAGVETSYLGLDPADCD
ncbi:MBL fold metallo-hydrolase [Henriciella sp. AS95]|uniref:MBL fold metallo-hydrolase n=1 Tax=Henriciella sp. AS95 TaxID=3135782 RepID=UPI0031809454